MYHFNKLYTDRGDRATKDNGVPAFDKRSHTSKYNDIIPDELIRRIIASPKAQEAVASILKELEKLKGDLNAFTTFLKSIKVDTNVIGALKAWSMIQAPDESKISFLEFLLQPQYHHHFSALLGAEGILALNIEIDLRGYLHEVGVLCRLLKAHRVGSQDKGSDVDVMSKVDHIGEQLDPEDRAKLQELYGTNLDLTLFTTSPDGLTVTWTNKGHLLVVWWLLSCNGIMPPLTPGQLPELLQVRITGFWALLACHFDLIPFLVHSGKSKEEAQAILQRGQEGTLTLDDMVALVKAFRTGRITIPEEQQIREKWLKALNSLIKQYLHIVALINRHNTADKDILIQQSGITGNALSSLRYIMYHGHQGSLEQEGVSDLLHQILNGASMFTSELTQEQGPMWKLWLDDYRRRIANSKSETREQNQPSASLTAEVLKLLLTQKPDHVIVRWFITKIRTVKKKHDGRNKTTTLSSYETSLMSIAKTLTPDTTDAELLSMLDSISLANLKKIIPTDEEVLNTIPKISVDEIERMSGMLMALNRASTRYFPFGDKGASLDRDGCVVFFITFKNAGTYIVKTPSGLYALRSLSSAITQGDDVSTLILMKGKDGKLCPFEIKNFYMDKNEKRVYVRENKEKAVHLDGTPVPHGVTITYEVVPAESSQILERYAILYLTGIMDEEFRKRLSYEPLNYTPKINQGKWRDLVHYIIRWVTDTLTELSVLLHMLRTIKAPQSLIACIEALKAIRDRLFQTIPQTDAIPQEFMQEWVSMLQEVFALGLHTPDVLAFIQRNGDINGLTEEQTEKIQQYIKTMYMDRLSFFKAIVFRMCQIAYGLFVCIPEKKHMIYVKAQLAEKVLQVLHEKNVNISIDTLMALLHRNYSLPSDIRLTSSLHVDFERFVLEALVVLFPCFTGQELCQMERGEGVPWLLVAPVPEPVQETLPALVPEPTPVQEAFQPAITIDELHAFVQKAKNRSVGSSWQQMIPLFIERYNKGHVDGELVATLMKIAKCDDILKAIANVAKSVNNGSQPQRIEALIVLLLTNYFGYGQKAFIASIKAGEGAYDATDDIKELPGRIAKLHQSLQAPAPAPTHVSAPAPVKVTLYKKFREEVYKGIGEFMRELLIIAVLTDGIKVIVVVENDNIFHVSPLPEGTLCIMSCTHSALSRELMSSMTIESTSTRFQLFRRTIPDTSPFLLVLTQERKKSSIMDLCEEVARNLKGKEINFVCIIPFGSSLMCTEIPNGSDFDCRVIILDGCVKPEGFKFKASDGTECDVSFTTQPRANNEHEVLFALLLGSKCVDASGNVIEIISLPSTLGEAVKKLLPIVGEKIHNNGLKGKDNPVMAFQSIQMMVFMMMMVVNYKKYPQYEPYTFFPEGFNKRTFVQFLKTSGLELPTIVNLFTRAQYCINRNGILKVQEEKYELTLAALPAPLKQLMLKFKEVTTEFFPKPSDKGRVMGVNDTLKWISTTVPQEAITKGHDDGVSEK
jgi:hypothetical protein